MSLWLGQVSLATCRDVAVAAVAGECQELQNIAAAETVPLRGAWDGSGFQEAFSELAVFCFNHWGLFCALLPNF